MERSMPTVQRITRDSGGRRRDTASRTRKGVFRSDLYSELTDIHVIRAPFLYLEKYQYSEWNEWMNEWMNRSFWITVPNENTKTTFCIPKNDIGPEQPYWTQSSALRCSQEVLSRFEPTVFRLVSDSACALPLEDHNLRNVEYTEETDQWIVFTSCYTLKKRRNVMARERIYLQDDSS